MQYINMSLFDAKEREVILCCLKSVTNESLEFIFGDPVDFKTIVGASPHILSEMAENWPDIDLNNLKFYFGTYVWLDYISEKINRGQCTAEFRNYFSCAPEDILVVAQKWKRMGASLGHDLKIRPSENTSF